MKQWNPAHKHPTEINDLEFKSHLPGLSSFKYLFKSLVFHTRWSLGTTDRKDHLFCGSQAVTVLSEPKGNQLQRAEGFVLGIIFPHAFSHPEKSKPLPPAHGQVGRAGRTKHWLWELLGNWLLLLTTLQLYYLFWYRVNDGPFALTQIIQNKTQTCFAHTAITTTTTTTRSKEIISLLSPT